MNSQRLDRLYDLLPAIYRIRDHEQGEPLRDLLRVIAEQVNVVEDNIAQLYENWFIETCEEWVMPYIGDLVGYRQLHDEGELAKGTDGGVHARNRILFPRRDVAATISNRRRKGTLALLEELALDVAGWPSRAVQFYEHLSRTQQLNHPRPHAGRTVNVRSSDRLARIDGPFDAAAHTIETRRIGSAHGKGRYNLPSVGLFVWRLKPYSVTKVPACCIEEVGPHCYVFSVLGNDSQLFVEPQAEADPTHVAEELNLPVSISRWAFDARKEDYYGTDKSLQIWAPRWGKLDSATPLPPEAIIPADLSDWSYRPPAQHVAVDPVLGRIVFPPSQLPKQGVRVSYRYAFSRDMGGGEYSRTLSEPADHVLVPVADGEEVRKIGDAWTRIKAEWAQHPDKPQNGVIEIGDSGVYVEQLVIDLEDYQNLQIRAASRCRPVLRLLDWQTDMPDALRVTMAAGSRITFDGLVITGRAVAIRSKPEKEAEEDPKGKGPDPCPAEVRIRHCTLVPGWSLHCTCEPKRPAEPSLELFNVRARVSVEKTIIGPIQVNEDQVRTDPIPITIADSILDATGEGNEALGAPGRPVAHAVLTILRSTVFGEIFVHAIELAENCIFTNCLNVARRQLGCMRFCYVPKNCRTPRRFHCQPDLAEKAIKERMSGENPAIIQAEIDAAQERERYRLRPQFNGVRYGRHDYAQLAEGCAEEITQGADDGSEMGVFHDLFQPQREANLEARIEEYTPAGMEAAIIFVS